MCPNFGVRSLTATQAGNANYNAATTITNSFIAVRATQSVSFSAPAVIPYGTPISLSATASSGLGISSYASSSNSIATVSGSTLTPTTNGVVTISAIQAGNANYQPSSNSVTINVEKPQSITFVAFSSVSYYNGFTITLSAKASSSNSITYVSSNTNVAVWNGSNALTVLGAGTSSITASQPGNGIYVAASPVSQILKVGKGSQTISFTPTSPVAFVNNGTFSLSASSTASNTGTNVTFASGNTSILSISGNTATMRAKGKVSVTATAAATANYNATSTTNSITLQ